MDAGVVAEHLTYGNLCATILVYAITSVVISFWRTPKYPQSLPWVGHGKSWGAALRNTLGTFQNGSKWVADGYNRYNKNNQSFVLPSTIGSPAEVVIPRSQLQWMLEKPDNVLSTSAAHYDLLRGDYSFIDKQILKDPYHERVIHKNLARALNALLLALHEEVTRVTDECFGFDKKDWRSINVLDAMMSMTPKITNRMLVGAPLCRDQVYLGRIAGLVPKYRFWRTSRQSLPIIRQRLQDIQSKDAGDPKYATWNEPQDFITWSIRTAMADGRPDEYDAYRIAMRLMPMNFAVIHTTSISGHGALLDIVSADPSVLEELREEAARIYCNEGGQWSKNGLSRMYKMDSAIRESLRFSTFFQTSVQRKVMPKEGILGPDGTHFAQGTILSCAWGDISRDEDIFPHADKYDAFRFSRDREAYEALAPEAKDQVKGLKLRQTALVTTSDSHLTFSHGRHACPGRFFVSHELKMLFAHLFLNYDIKHLEERPKAFWLGRNVVPPMKACIEIRRRNATWPKS